MLTAKRKGHGVHSPFVYALCENVFYNPHPYYDFERLAQVRSRLLQDDTLLQTENFGAGSRKFRSSERKVSALARHGISSRKQSEVLYRLANFMKCNSILELGTSLGLNTLYLASHNPACKVITVEGSASLHDFARKLAEETKVTNTSFRSTLR